MSGRMATSGIDLVRDAAAGAGGSDNIAKGAAAL